MAPDSIGPTMVLTVPPIRKSFGWKPAERIPTTFPCEFKSSLTIGHESGCISVGADQTVPNRPREAVSGYEDS